MNPHGDSERVVTCPDCGGPADVTYRRNPEYQIQEMFHWVHAGRYSYWELDCFGCGLYAQYAETDHLPPCHYRVVAGGWPFKAVNRRHRDQLKALARKWKKETSGDGNA